MKETLINRVGRIISGSVHSLMDSVENAAPETVLTEAIREVESAIDDIRQDLGQVVAKKHLAGTKLMEENKRHENLGEKIKIAVGENRDDLAEAAIARQFDIEAQIPVLEATLKDCNNQEKELENYLNALMARRREMNEELIQFRESAKAAGNTTLLEPQSGGQDSVESRVNKAETAFDRVIERATGLPGQAGATGRKTAAQLAELEELARKNQIQERLARIKGDAESS